MEESRLDRLEKELSELKSKLGNSVEKPKKEKKPRAPSEYNTFMKNFIAERKTKTGADYDHKTVFKEAAEAWSKKKQTGQN
jgi:hypothetical protein|tara:strand:+ start:11058 stop:11300 length:243 start_codon:yes stop_codon:yes gene_type:complete